MSAFCRFTVDKTASQRLPPKDEEEKDDEPEPVITAELIILEKLLGNIRPAASDSEQQRAGSSLWTFECLQKVHVVFTCRF
jgi:hypothetical protein